MSPLANSWGTVAPRRWAVVVAAGVGKRMGSELPKQYLSLAGKPLLHRTLAPFLASPLVDAVVLVLAANDPYWPQLAISHAKLHCCTGGAERSLSVANALTYIVSQQGQAQDWVLIHDAARPCLSEGDLERLIITLTNHPVGGLLASPVADTLKRANDRAEVVATVDRSHLWRALTPQMFRLQLLQQALVAVQAAGVAVTDDASAVEYLGLRPALVLGKSSNLKVTLPADLLLAEQILAAATSGYGQ
ncbi:MAG: 2-C-methyl-D-erythritol 4-phosphate cytidylyltransferase [Gammaproteobacteria bacterium]|nr:2-C-methyl-D-erythritol 4-phosphate cytidylyltransferase [Gammaproteobacteria bacterium]